MKPKYTARYRRLQMANGRPFAQIKATGAGKSWSSVPRAPLVLAWRLGKAMLQHVAYRCVNCSGWHLARHWRYADGDTARTPQCPPCFATTQPTPVNLKVASGLAPQSVTATFVDVRDLGDLIVFFDAIAGDGSMFRVGTGAHRIFAPCDVWLPEPGQVGLALNCLRKFELFAEARCIRQTIGVFFHRSQARLLASDEWCASVGPLARAMLLDALRDAWRSCGR